MCNHRSVLALPALKSGAKQFIKTMKKLANKSQIIVNLCSEREHIIVPENREFPDRLPGKSVPGKSRISREIPDPGNSRIQP